MIREVTFKKKDTKHIQYNSFYVKNKYMPRKKTRKNYIKMLRVVVSE